MTFLLTENNLALGVDVISLDQNQPAPFKGYLFSEDKANQIKVQLIDYDQLKLINASYDKSINLYKANEKLYDDKINLLLVQNDKLAQASYDATKVSEWQKVGYFLLGVVSVGLGAYVGTQATK